MPRKDAANSHVVYYGVTSRISKELPKGMSTIEGGAEQGRKRRDNRRAGGQCREPFVAVGSQHCRVQARSESFRCCSLLIASSCQAKVQGKALPRKRGGHALPAR